MSPKEAVELADWIGELFPNVSPAQSVEMRDAIVGLGKSTVIAAVKRYNLTHNFLSTSELVNAINDQRRRESNGRREYESRRRLEKELDTMTHQHMEGMTDIELEEIREGLIAGWAESLKAIARKGSARNSSMVFVHLRDILRAEAKAQ